MKNIVVINPDQMRFDFMTPAGHPFIATEHLSRLASMGTHFNHAYTACPMCGPARTSFLTCQYPAEHGVRNYWGTMPAERPNLMNVLGEGGYHRAIFGKDHVYGEGSTDYDAVGVLYDEGEDICIGNMDDHPDYAWSYSSGVLEKGCRWDLTERLTDAGLDYIERRSATDRPFFVTLNFQDPHPYFACPEPYASLFLPDQFELPSNFRRDTCEGEPARMHLWRHHSRSLQATEKDFLKAMAMYCGQIRYVDDQVGRVLDKLEELGQIDNTIVIFWSDHGEFVGDYGVTHKMPIYYDCMARVPMLVWDPSGTLPRGRCDDLVECMDIVASTLDLVGLPRVPGSRAHSLVGTDYEPRRDVYAEGGLYLQSLDEPIEGLNLRAPHPPTQFGPGAMLRTHDWKLSIFAHDRGELFDMRNDPHECHNRFDDPECAEIRQQMTVRLLQRQLCRGQAPEHLPRTVAGGVTSDGLPIWADDHGCTEGDRFNS